MFGLQYSMKSKFIVDLENPCYVDNINPILLLRLLNWIRNEQKWEWAEIRIRNGNQNKLDYIKLLELWESKLDYLNYGNRNQNELDYDKLLKNVK